MIPDPNSAALKWHAQHGVVPINHMVCVTESLAKSKPEAVVEIFRMLAASKAAADLPKPERHRFPPLWPRCLPPGLADHDQIHDAAEAAAARLEVDELFATPRVRCAPDAEICERRRGLPVILPSQ